MFTLITITAVSGFFSRTGEAREVRFHADMAAADVLRYARELARKPHTRRLESAWGTGVKVG